jgi:hypothetical protein
LKASCGASRGLGRRTEVSDVGRERERGQGRRKDEIGGRCYDYSLQLNVKVLVMWTVKAATLYGN